MSDSAKAIRKPTARKVASALFYGFIGGAIVSKALVDWLFDGPDWARVAVWSSFFVGWALLELLVVTDDPPRRSYRRVLAERGLGRRPTDGR